MSRTSAALATPTTAGVALAIENLHIGQCDGGATVVEGVTLSLERGEILGLVGESGSGKTTVGLAVLGYVRRGLAFAAGAVRIGGSDILALDEGDRRRVRRSLVSYVPQDPATALNPSLRVSKLLRESVAGAAPLSDSALARLLEDVRLPTNRGFLEAFPHQLSGGQQQRVGIAMAFARQPQVIVLDEPTTGLDVTTQAHVLETIRRLCLRQEVAAIYVSHDLAVVGALASTAAQRL